MCTERAAQRARRHVEDECASTVDLDDRQQLPVPALEVGIAADVDLFELEALLGANRGERGPSALAQMTALSAVENDSGYG